MVAGGEGGSSAVCCASERVEESDGKQQGSSPFAAQFQYRDNYGGRRLD